MKKLNIILVLFLLTSCVLNTGEKESPISQGKDLTEKKDIENGGKASGSKPVVKNINENQSDAVLTPPTINKVVSNLNGNTLMNLGKEMEDGYKKSSENQLVKDMEQLAFFEDCINKGKTDISDFGQNYISESPIFFNALNQESFSRDMAIALALDKYSNCLLVNYYQVQAKVARFYYYQNLAKSLAASFFIKSVLTGYSINSVSWCSNLKGQVTAEEMCKNLGEEKIIDILINYYKITGHLIKDEQGADISHDNDKLRLFIKNKIQAIIKSIESPTMQKTENPTDPELSKILQSSDFGISLHGIIEPVDELFKSNN
ncbi:MAG: hypothetical protein PHF50_01510 [Patescibacteria group bacterium]|nr:hypothetical protein [Patescibacteria group bacterium]